MKHDPAIEMAPATPVAVVGRGLIGAAAARHLSRMGCQVTLIGPPEPADYARHEGVFGSHHDEGRITRRIESHPFWLGLNRASIARYGEIAAASGIDFYRETGVLHIGAKRDPGVVQVGEVAAAAGIPCEVYEDEGLARRFAFLRLTQGQRGCFEPHEAGYISPRRLVQAQTVAAQRAGARLVDEPALGVSEHGTGVTITTTTRKLEATRVLVAAGGHTAGLLGLSPGVKVFGRTVAMFRMDAVEARRLAGMPPMRCFGPRGQDPYILPPIAYPDGHTWLKIGGDPADLELGTDADIKAWFRSGGSTSVADGLQAQLQDRLHALRFESRRVVPCMTTFSDTGLPKIGPVSGRVAVAFGCHGKSAKCSDELGRLGALAVLGQTLAELAP